MDNPVVITVGEWNDLTEHVINLTKELSDTRIRLIVLEAEREESKNEA